MLCVGICFSFIGKTCVVSGGITVLAAVADSDFAEDDAWQGLLMKSSFCIFLRGLGSRLFIKINCNNVYRV